MTALYFTLLLLIYFVPTAVACPEIASTYAED
jgi:hypothetical protein